MVWGSLRVRNMIDCFFSLVSHIPFLSLNSGAQHDDQDHDLESNSDQSTRANNSDQNRCYHDQIQQNSNMMSSTSPGPSASPVETERSVELTTTIDSSSSSASTQTPTQENLSKENRPFHRIIETLREQDLGRHTLFLAVPMTIGLFSVDKLASEPLALRLIAVALALGFAGIWNGILLRTTWNEASNMIELLGVAFMLLAFSGFVALFLPESLVWIPFLCGVLSLLPLVIATIDSSSSSASTQTPTQENLSKENRPFHRIIETLREQKLGTYILFLASVPMTIGLFSVDKLASEPLALRLIAVALALGFAGIWNGISLRTTWNEASNMIELLGVAFMLLAFSGFVALFLPESLVWIPFLCGVLSLLPLVIATIDSSSSSASTQTPTQENLSKENRPFHRIIETLREQKLGTYILFLASVPMTIGLFSVDKLASEPLALRLIAVALALGFAGIWNGISLRTTWNEASNMIELLGVAFMLLAFSGFVALFLPESLVWIPFLCGVLSLLPLVIATIDSSSSSASTQTPTQENLSKENRPFHRIIETLREQKLGTYILFLASVPMTIGLFSVDKLASEPLALRLIAVALALGFAGIWNGILLRTTWNEASNMIELLGVAFMLLAFSGFVALFLPESLVWIPFLCWVLSLLPLVIAICSGERASEDREG